MPTKNIVPKTLRFVLLTPVFCIISFPALAAGWDCRFTVMSGSGKGLQGAAKIEIHGDTADWLVLMPSAQLGSNAAHWSKFPRRILVNNNIGLVAADPEAYVVKDVGPVVGSSITALNKQNGDLHIGSIGMLGANEIMAGHCKPK